MDITKTQFNSYPVDKNLYEITCKFCPNTTLAKPEVIAYTCPVCYGVPDLRK